MRFLPVAESGRFADSNKKGRLKTGKSGFSDGLFTVFL